MSNESLWRDRRRPREGEDHRCGGKLKRRPKYDLQSVVIIRPTTAIIYKNLLQEKHYIFSALRDPPFTLLVLCLHFLLRYILGIYSSLKIHVKG